MRTKRVTGCGATVLMGMAVAAAPAGAHDGATGGAATPSAPHVERLSCGSAPGGCRRGQALQVAGEALASTRRVVFLGAHGQRDDRFAQPSRRSSHRVIVVVPSRARSGPMQLISGDGSRSAPRRLRVRPAAGPPMSPSPAPVASGDFTFPIRGDHDLGQSVSNRFGGWRGHQGQDLFALCGTPVVAARAGTVIKATFESRAGNYVVIGTRDGPSHVYMHMRTAPLVSRGEHVNTGQQLGDVGETGRATGCHLHFELWTAPGWYQGGQPVDPLPDLRRWDTATHTVSPH